MLAATLTGMLGIAALLGLAYIFLVPLIIIFTFRQSANPNVLSLEETTSFPKFIQEQFDEASQELAQLGFQWEENAYLPNQVDNVKVILHLYSNRESKEAVMVVTMLALIDGAWTQQNQYCEFTAKFQNGLEINTNNTPEVYAFKVPKNVITTRAPWIEEISDLYRAHVLVQRSEARQQPKDFSLDTKFQGDVRAYIADGMRQELHNAAADGYIKLNEDESNYVATFWGGYVMTWKQLPPFKGFYEAYMNRQAKRRLANAGFREDT